MNKVNIRIKIIASDDFDAKNPDKKGKIANARGLRLHSFTRSLISPYKRGFYNSVKLKQIPILNIPTKNNLRKYK